MTEQEEGNAGKNQRSEERQRMEVVKRLNSIQATLATFRQPQPEFSIAALLKAIP